MKIKAVCPYSFGANTYLIVSGSHSFVVDPAASVEAIMSAVADEGAVLDGILLTHGHFDHTVSLDTLRRATATKAYIHEDDAVMLTDGRKNAFYTFYGKECVHAPAEHLLTDGEMIRLGDEEIRVIHTPGHTPGSVCYDCGEFIICGDTLFSHGYGRYDLPGGDPQVLFSSLKKLADINKNPVIHPGHGASCTLAEADVIRAIKK